MSTAPPGDQSRPLFYRTAVAHFEGPDGETPLGVRVVEPAPETRQALRGNLYAIVDLVGENPGRAHLAESLLSAIQRAYFTRSGSQSQVLTEAVRQARLRVNEFNQSHPDQPVQLGVICAGLVRSRLMIAHSGPAFAFITANSQIVRYPTEIETFSPLSSTQASGAPADWEIYSQEVQEQTALFMGTPRWLDVVPVRTIAGSVAHINADNLGDAASGLLATSSRPDLPGLLLVVEQTDTPPAPPAPKTPPRRRSPLLGSAGLATAVNAPPPVVGVPDMDGDDSGAEPVPSQNPPEDESHQDRPTDSAVEPTESTLDDNTVAAASRVDEPRDHALPNAQPGVIDGSESSDDFELDGRAIEDAAIEDDMFLAGPIEIDEPEIDEIDEIDDFDEAEPTGPSTFAKLSAGLAAGAALGFDRTREVLSGVFPERHQPDQYPSEDAVYDGESLQAEVEVTAPDDVAWDEVPDGPAVGALVAASDPVDYRYDEAAAADSTYSEPVNDGAAAKPSFYEDATARINAALDDGSAPFEPPKPSSGGRSRLFITLAILIVVLVPVVAIAVTGGRGTDTTISVASYTEMAETFLLNAQVSMDNGDSDSARDMFLKANESLNDAVALSGHTPQTDQLYAEINAGLAEVMQTRYLYQLADPLVTFPEDAEPFRVMTVGESIFVMDRADQTVQRFELDSLREFVPDPEPEVVMSEGLRVDGATIAGMVDMAWQPIVAGYEDRPKLLVLDRSGQIFSYDPRVDGVQPITLSDSSPLENPTQMDLFLGRTYIADEGQNQIFRYDPGGLSTDPSGWFAEDTKPYISGLLAMSIDGDIWLLNSEGTLIRYNSGEQVPFSLDSGAVRADEPVDMAIGSQGDSSIFIADAAHDRILAFDKEGTYQYQLVASEGEPLKDLRGLYVDELDEQIYILTKTALYQHPLPE